MITSTSNIQVKKLIQLQKKSKLRKEEQVFVAEGIRMFRETPKDRIVRAYISESLFAKEVIDTERLRYEVLSDAIFAKVSDTKTPQGILCIVKREESSVEKMLAKEQPFLVLLENLQDPGNLGTIIRASEAAGADGILMSADCVDIYNPKVIRSTMGGIYRVPFAYVEDLPGTMEMLENKGVRVYAAHLEGSVSYDEQDYRTGCAFLIGNEGNGLTKEATQAASGRIRIPMCGQVESLNAAVAASVLMFEAARQRRKRP
jgi:TrmH family RNA methyltransferase